MNYQKFYVRKMYEPYFWHGLNCDRLAIFSSAAVRRETYPYMETVTQAAGRML